MARTTRGRQKLKMVKIQNEQNRRVTFSKRRLNLFKKASELVSMCAAEVALIVFSPMGKIYTFGHPTVQTIIQKYLGNVPTNHHPSSNRRDFMADAQRAILAVDLSHELKSKEKQLEREKKAGEIMDVKIKNSPLYELWNRFSSVDELNLAELFKLKMALEKLKMEINTVKMNKTLEMSQFMGFTKICHQNVGESLTGAACSPPELDLLGRLGHARRP